MISTAGSLVIFGKMVVNRLVVLQIIKRNTVMVILIWLYLNSIAILIGFELNVSIRAARAEDEKVTNTVSCNGEIV